MSEPTTSERTWIEIQGCATNVEVVAKEQFTRGKHDVTLCVRDGSGILKLWEGPRYDSYEECVQARIARLLANALQCQKDAMDAAENIRRLHREEERKAREAKRCPPSGQP